MLFQKNESGCLEWEHAPNCLDATDVTLAVARELLVKTPCPIAEAAPLIVKALQRGFEFFFAGHWATQIDFTTQPAFREVARTGPAPACGILTSRVPPVNRRHASLPAPAPNPETPEPPAAATHPPHPPPPSPLGAPSPWLG